MRLLPPPGTLGRVQRPQLRVQAGGDQTQAGADPAPQPRPLSRSDQRQLCQEKVPEPEREREQQLQHQRGEEQGGESGPSLGQQGRGQPVPVAGERGQLSRD